MSRYLKEFAKVEGKEEADSEEERLRNPEALARWWWPRRRKVAFIDVTSATNARTMVSTALAELPCGNSTPVLGACTSTLLPAILNSFSYDAVARFRCGGVHLNWFVIDESILPSLRLAGLERVSAISLALTFPNPRLAEFWIAQQDSISSAPWRRQWALTAAERLRQRCVLDAVIASRFALTYSDLSYLLRDCDYERPSPAQMDPKGFWRVDKDKEPELRHTVLALVAFHDLEAKIRAYGGDREKGIEAFLTQNDGDGWMLPEVLRLADYGLGRDERAETPQRVASRLGPRFYDWQLAQTVEESWRECYLHVRNLLGESGYRQLFAEIDAGNHSSPPVGAPEASSIPSKFGPQRTLFD